MKRAIVAFFVLILLMAVLWTTLRSSPVHASGSLALAGRVLDPQGQPVREARVVLYLDDDGSPVQGKTDPDGLYVLDLPDEPIGAARLTVSHPHFEPTTWRASPADLAHLNRGAAVRVPDLALERRVTPGFWIAGLVFAGVLGLIVTERLHSTTAALLGIATELGLLPDVVERAVARALEQGKVTTQP